MTRMRNLMSADSALHPDSHGISLHYYHLSEDA